MPNFVSPKMLASQWVQRKFGVASSGKFETHKEAYMAGYVNGWYQMRQKAVELAKEMKQDQLAILLGGVGEGRPDESGLDD